MPAESRGRVEERERGRRGRRLEGGGLAWSEAGDGSGEADRSGRGRKRAGAGGRRRLMCKTCVVMQRGERTTEYAVVEAYNRKMQMQLQHLLQLLQLRFDLHFEDADPTPAAAGDGLTPPLPSSPPPPPPRPVAHHLRRRLGPSRRNPSLASATAAAPLGRLWCIRAAAMDESGSTPVFPNVRTPEDVFRDFRGRRAGILKALTTDVEQFYKMCDPEKENLCLYGLSNETWEVTLPAEEVPPELPEPALGINFARDGMAEKDWLMLVAVHSDAWLIAVAFYFGARFGFDKDARRRLFTMISNLPTVYEIVTGSGKRPSKTPNSNSKSKSASKPSKKPNSNSKPGKQLVPKQEEQTLKEEGGAADQSYLCGTCGGSYSNNGDFWIGCDICENWYHGDCVRITPAKAEHIKQYKCPACSNKRGRE